MNGWYDFVSHLFRIWSMSPRETYIWKLHFNQQLTNVCMHAESPQSSLTLCAPMSCSPPMDCSLPGSCPWDSPGKNIGVAMLPVATAVSSCQCWRVAMPISRGSARPRDRTCISYVSLIDRWVLYYLNHLGSPANQCIVTLKIYQKHWLLIRETRLVLWTVVSQTLSGKLI